MRLAAAGGDSAAIFGVNLGSNTVRLTAIHNPRGHCLPPVQYAQNFDPCLLHPIDGYEWRPADDQFTGSYHAACAAHERMPCQHVRLAFDLLIQPRGCGGIVFRDVVQLLKPGARRGLEPANRQAVAFLLSRDFPSHAARLVALLRFTSSWESHAAWGSSASSSARCTSARNHASCSRAARCRSTNSRMNSRTNCDPD